MTADGAGSARGPRPGARPAGPRPGPAHADAPEDVSEDVPPARSRPRPAVDDPAAADPGNGLVPGGRPRPRPAATPASEREPVPERPQEPDPVPASAQPPEPPVDGARPRPRPPVPAASRGPVRSASRDAASRRPDGLPDPDISRFLAAHEPQPGDDDREKGPSLRSRLRASRVSRSITRLVILLAVVVIVIVVLRTYVVAPYYIPSQSMEPTLVGCPSGCTDDRVLVDKIGYRFHDPRVGDIVVFSRPPDFHENDAYLIKRVVAVGGQRVTLRDGLVYVDGQHQVEPYVNKACGSHPTGSLTGRTSWLVPAGDVFVMGDNRCDSEDSRAFGPISDATIVGRAFLIVWPVHRITIL